MDIIIEGGKSLKGRVRVPADKSITHRGLLFAALAEGESVIRALRPGADNVSSSKCIEALGVRVEGEEGLWHVHSPGFAGWRAPAHALDCGNSGTTMRLLSGMLAGRGLALQLVGDESLHKRPMGRVCEPLRQLGANIHGNKVNGRELPPLHIGQGAMHDAELTSPIASAQVKSALLLAGVTGNCRVRVSEPYLSRDHTERMLRSMGAQINTGADFAEYVPGATLQPLNMESPGDISSAAFMLAIGLLVPGSDIVIEGVGVNPTRTGIVDILNYLGADVVLTATGDQGGEPVGSLRASHRALYADDLCVHGAIIPRLVDELVVLTAVFAAAQGRVVVRDASDLKVKESDRIDETVKLLHAFGLEAQGTDDGFIIEGPQSPHAARVDVGGDHRLAMTAAVLALWADGTSVLENFEIADVSYPGFVNDLNALGAAVRVV